MNDHDERDIRDRFAALREAERRGVPDFHRLARPAANPGRGWVPLTAALAVAAGVTALVLIPRHGGGAASLDEALAQASVLSSWSAPTDDFLRLTDFDIPDSVPTLELTSVTLPEAPSATSDTGDPR